MIFVRSMSKKLNVAKQLSKMKKEQWARARAYDDSFLFEGQWIVQEDWVWGRARPLQPGYTLLPPTQERIQYL